MPKMNPRGYTPVTVTNVDGAVYINGGYLETERPWKPDVTEVEGRMYVPLHKLSKNLKDFLGKPLHFCKFFDDLLLMRNTVCDEIIKTAVAQSDPLGQLRKANSKRERISEVQLPEVVKLAVQPPVGKDEFDMHVLFASDYKSVVRIQVDVESLEYLILAVDQEDGYGLRGRKRSHEDRVRFDFKEILWNYKRNCPYVIYKDADGAQHTKTVKPSSPVKAQEHVDENSVTATVNTLHEFFEKCKRSKSSKESAASEIASETGN